MLEVHLRLPALLPRQEVIRWIDRKHPRTGWRQLRRQYSTGNGWPAVGNVVLFNPETARIERYRYRGTKIPGHGQKRHDERHENQRGPVERPCLVMGTPGAEGGFGETGRLKDPHRAPARPYRRSPMELSTGRRTAREADTCGGNRMAKKRMTAAERQQESEGRWLHPPIAVALV